MFYLDHSTNCSKTKIFIVDVYGKSYLVEISGLRWSRRVDILFSNYTSHYLQGATQPLRTTFLPQSPLHG